MKTEEQLQQEKRLRIAAAAYGAMMATEDYSQAMKNGLFPPDLKKELYVHCWKHCVKQAMEVAQPLFPTDKLASFEEIPWRLLADPEARKLLQKFVDEMVDGFIADIGKAGSELGTDPAKQ